VDERTLVTRHLETLLAESRAEGVPDDAIGRLLLEATVTLWQASRSADDIASELQFMAEHLDPGADFAFMRP
jgi:hypothetical protein